MAARVRRRLTRGPKPAEASVAYRVAVMATVIVAVIAIAAEGAVGVPAAVLSLVLIPAGYVVSYVRRDRTNVAIKTVLALGLFVAFANFLREVRLATSIDDARTPLAGLFLWVQVQHSFDLPRRRDLNFSFASSVALMALAGVLSLEGTYGIVLAAYAVAALTALTLGHLSDLRERAGPHVARAARNVDPLRGAVRPAAAMLAVATALSATAFVALPRLPGIKVTTLPFSFDGRSPIANFAGQVVNPGGGRSGDGTFAPDSYFGYGDEMDLRVRGRLDDRLVLRVRAPEGAFWRGQVFDAYDGRRWTSTDDDPRRFAKTWGPSIDLPTIAAPSREMIQTFYVERPQPNLAFHALEARELFVSAGSVRVDAFGSIRLPYTMDPGAIYSVVSQIPSATPAQLRAAPRPDPDDPALARYTQLPDALPGRVRSLGRSLAGGAPNTHDAALAVQRWLRDNTRYRLDVPRDPPGAEPIDHFLFERRTGFCEQIASSMTVLLRAAGIPARIATGYTPGRRNPFTGYWEVRNSDAHSWVEVYYPGHGWIEYDPTHEVPQAEGAGDLFIARPLLRFIGGAIPAPVARAVRSAAGAVADGVRRTPAVPVAAVVTVAGLVALVSVLRRRTARPTGARDRIVAAWTSVEDALRAHGVRRGPGDTVREVCRRARGRPGADRALFDALADGFDRARYGPRTVTTAQAGDYEELAARARTHLADRRTPTMAGV